MTANYQDVTPEMIRAVAEFLSNDPAGDRTAAGRLERIAKVLEADAKLDAEAEELEALGGTEAAERGWNALRKHNPKVDRSTGKTESDDIHVFADLPHRQKLNYAVFAAGVLDVKPPARVFKTISEIPDEVALLINEETGTLMKRRGSGWWYVDTPDSPVRAGKGWPLDPHEFPLTEYVQETN